MFGKPEWFRKKTCGWGLTPITFLGRAYAVTWAAVLVAPFTLLLVRQQPIEALVWIATSGGLMLYDMRHIMVAMNPPPADTPADDVLYIGDEKPPVSQMATRNFDFQLRR
jgi:hypothetical protein